MQESAKNTKGQLLWIYTSVIFYRVTVGFGLKCVALFKIGSRSLVCITWGVVFRVHTSAFWEVKVKHVRDRGSASRPGSCTPNFILK